MGFEQATIKVEREQEFGELHRAIARVFESGRVEQFLKCVDRSSKRIRDFQAVLDRGMIEQVDEALAQSKRAAIGLYNALSESDQGQMREFYLSQMEQVEPALRTKFQKIYRYY